MTPPAERGGWRRGLIYAAALLVTLAACRRQAVGPATTGAAPPAAAPPSTAPPSTAPSATAQVAIAAESDATASDLPVDATRTALLAGPHATVAAVVDWSSVLKPCGCTDELQRGGVERIVPWLRRLHAADPALAVVHAGQLLTEVEPPREGEQGQRALRQQTFLRLLVGLPIAGVAVSSEDLKQGGDAARALLAKAGLPLLADGWAHGVEGVVPHRLHSVPGQAPLGLFALDPGAGDHEVQVQTAQRHVAALRAKGAARVVALSNLGLRGSRRLARAVPELDAIVVGAVPERFEPAEEVEREGTTFVLEAPRQGASVAVLTLPGAGQDRRFAYHAAALPWTEPTDPATTAAVRAYEAEAARINATALSTPRAAAPGAARYLGQQACLGCHAAVQPFAAADRHHHAFGTLKRQGKERDADCVGCHVTGWQQPGGSAFANLETLQHVQCEACHGPGSLHVAAADKASPLAGFIRRPGETQCLHCHTPEHAPRFDFSVWRGRLLVPGHGLPAAAR